MSCGAPPFLGLLLISVNISLWIVMNIFLHKVNMVLKFIDIGANLTDPMFRGIYGSAQKHPDDLQHVLDRAWKQGMQRVIITVGSANEANNALDIATTDERLFLTMGCHPTRCGEFAANPESYYRSLQSLIAANLKKVVAVGECGLDYDRLHFCDKNTQQIYFERQLDLADEFSLPLFLHCRSAHHDFFKILERNIHKIESCGGGVVHSFDGTIEEAQRLLELSDKIYIGLNGCSLKTSDNLTVVKQLPNNRLMLETDCPWCGIRPSHAGSKFIRTNFATIKKKDRWTAETLVDGRNEPCQIIQVLEILAAIKEQPMEALANTFYENTINFFFKKST